MVRKFFILVFLVLLISPVIAQENVSFDPGILYFKGNLDEEQFTLFLHFEQKPNIKETIKAIKITFEPGGTVAALIYDENCSEEEVKLFLDGKESLSLLKTTSFERLDPIIYFYPQASYLANEAKVVIEYYIENEEDNLFVFKGGELSLKKPLLKLENKEPEN